MALLDVEKRTRTLSTDTWSEWASTTDIPPYTTTELVEYRSVEESSISLYDLTDGSTVDGEWVGTGIFDRLIAAVNENIDIQYQKDRIKGTEYANVYLGGLQSVLQQSIAYLLQRDATEAKTDVTKEQKNLLVEQQALVIRQTKGFDDDAKQKLLKQALDSWSVAYSVAQDENSIPDTITVNVIDSLMKDAYTNLGIAVTNDPIGE